MQDRGGPQKKHKRLETVGGPHTLPESGPGLGVPSQSSLVSDGFFLSVATVRKLLCLRESVTLNSRCPSMLVLDSNRPLSANLSALLILELWVPVDAIEGPAKPQGPTIAPEWQHVKISGLRQNGYM